MSSNESIVNESPLEVSLNDTISTPKKRIRSDIERRRIRIDKLESYLKRMILSLEYYSKLDLNGIAPFYEYLNWAKLKLQGFKTLDSEVEKDKIALKIQYFELYLKNTIKYYNGLIEYYASKNSSKSAMKHYYTGHNFKQPAFEYNQFLENGINIFIHVIDVYQLWLKPCDLVPILRNRIPDTLSYVLVAVLARYTMPNTNPNFKQIYGSSIRNAIKSLPAAYNMPCINNVTALGFLTYLALSRFKLNSTIKYFSAAVRMAQSLGIDKEEEHPSSIERQHSSNVWKALSLTYMILSTTSPNFPTFNMKFKAFKLELPKGPTCFTSEMKADGTQVLTQEEFISNEVGKKLAEVFMVILCRVQDVKSDHKFNDLSLIPNELLRLPSKEFNECITTLMSIRNYCIPDGMIFYEISNDFESFTPVDYMEPVRTEHLKLSKQFKTVYESLYIHLYYPMVLVYPQPVSFTPEELTVIHHSANLMTCYILKSYNTHPDSYDHKAVLIQMSVNQPNAYNIAYESPHYLQAVCPIYVYFNLLHLYITNPTVYPTNHIMKQEAIRNTSILFRILEEASKINPKRRFNDATYTLNQVKNAMTRFSLPVELEIRINDSVFY